MSVLMVMKVPGDVEKFEQFAAENSELFEKVAGEGKARGAAHHAFFAGDGEIVVVDEWDEEENFLDFFNSNEDIPPIMQQVATGEPQISFYRPLETSDKF